jgi:hypothetical protein
MYWVLIYILAVPGSWFMHNSSPLLVYNVFFASARLAVWDASNVDGLFYALFGFWVLCTVPLLIIPPK